MQNVRGELMRCKYENIKPNMLELGRIYNMDRRTVKKMLDQIGKEEKTPKKKRLSKLTKYDDLIVEKLSIPRSNKKAAYMYIIVNVDNDIGSYSNFIKYVNNHLKDRIEIEKNKKRLIQKLIT